jgi:hypothetical protein
LKFVDINNKEGRKKYKMMSGGSLIKGTLLIPADFAQVLE